MKYTDADENEEHKKCTLKYVYMPSYVHKYRYTQMHVYDSTRMQIHEIIHINMYLQEIKSYRHVKSTSNGQIQFICFWIYTNHNNRIYKLGHVYTRTVIRYFECLQYIAETYSKYF